MEEPTEFYRYAITASLLYASYITLTCPCKHYNGDNKTAFLSCHIGQVAALTGIPLLLALYINRFNLLS